MEKRNKISLMFSLIFIIAVADAQDIPWNIVVARKDTLSDCTLLEVRDSVLVFSGISRDSVSIDSVDLVFRTTESSFWTSAGYGALIGAVTGAVIAAATHEEQPGSLFRITPGVAAMGGGVAGAVGGFAIGGLIGGTSGGTEIHDLSNLPHRARFMTLHNLIVGTSREP